MDLSEIKHYGQFRTDVFNKLGIEFKAGRKMLEIGCGDGQDSDIFKNVYGLDVTATDLYKHDLIQSRKLNFKKASAFKLPFEDNSYDYIFLFDVLHHLDEENQDFEKQRSALRELKRVVKPGGLIIALEGNRYNPLFYPHMVKFRGHDHFTQGYFKKLIRSEFPKARFKYFEAHVYPKAFLKFWKFYEYIMERFSSKQFLSYNVALIGRAKFLPKPVRKFSLSSMFMRLFDESYAMNDSNILDFIESNEKAKFLDLGCDNGIWTKKVARKIGTMDVHGIEIVEESAELARGQGIKVKVADLNEKFPYKDNSIDVIHANQVIEHISDLDNFVEEIYRVLKPGGYAVVSTENGSSWHNIAAALMGWQIFSLANFSKRHRGVGNPLSAHRHDKRPMEAASWTHKTIFNYRGLKEFFEFTGFKRVKIAGAGYYPLPTILGKWEPRHSHFITIKAFK